TSGATRPARMAMTVITTSSSISVKPSLVIRDTEHLLDRRDAACDLGPAVLAQSAHALSARDVAQLVERLLRGEGLLELVGDHQQLEQARAAAVPGVAALGTAAAALERLDPDRLLR